MWFDNANMRYQLHLWVQTHPPTTGRHTMLISPHRCTNTLTVYTRDPADWLRWGVKQITKPLASSPPPNRCGEQSFQREKVFRGYFRLQTLAKGEMFEWRSCFGGCLKFARVMEHVMCSTGFFMVSNALSFNKGMFYSLYRMFSLEARRRKFRETLFQESSS